MRIGGVVHSLLLACGAAGIATSFSGTRPAPEKLDFSRDILPILSDKCFKCHGPDSSSRMAGLRLDTPDGAYANRDGQWAIVPGKPGDSLLVKKINDPDSPMPPASSGKSLTKKEKETLERWIAEGAKYAKLWSFEPLPDKVAVPQIRSSWPKDDIDRFILEKLQSEHLSPSAPAPKWRWLRRVTLDLTGLPPTEKEIADFDKDTSPKAYEKVVDRLLASPHFGERMAVDWLDAARYSDSYGYQSDLLMPTWPYRDWVVKSFNEGLPYDQFLIDQLAGDQLPNPTREQRLATAFNRLHRQSNEGGSITLEFKTEYAVDRVSTFGTAVLGLTLGCARCHDHKFDPIKQKEFYQLFAYFNSIPEYGLLLSTEIVPTPSLLLPNPDQEAKLKDVKGRLDAARQELAKARLEASKSLAGSAQATPTPPLLKCTLDSLNGNVFANAFGTNKVEKIGSPVVTDGVSGKALELDGDNGIVIRGLPAVERYDPFTWSFWIKDPRQTGPIVLLHRTGGTDVGFCGFDLMLEDGFLTARVMRQWPGNAVAVRTKARIPKDSWTNVAWSWDGCGSASGLHLYVDGKLAEAEVLNDRLWKRIHAYGDLGPSGGDWSFGQRFRDAGFKGGCIDEIAYFDKEASVADIAALSNPRARLDPSERAAAQVESNPRVIAAKDAIRSIEKELTGLEEGVFEISVMEDTPTEVPAYLLARGAYDAPRTEENRVERGVPAALPPLKVSGANNRLALAKWVTSPNHPLTSRVFVNRLWQMMFGTGIVETSENFGSQGSQPTHPELLDYLARQFVDSGWNIKALLKRLALSATYRQDSLTTPEARKKDPLNRFLSRGPSQRLSAEMVRDTALAASGLLKATVGGPPVNAYQPAGIWQENNTMSPGFVQSTGTDLYRRSLYSTWKRTTPVPSMMLFDATSREACTVRRPATNSPMQALVLLNDVQFVEAARVLAEVALKAPGDDQKRFEDIFLRLSGRRPDQREAELLKATLDEQRLYFRGHILDAGKLIEFGDSKPDPSLRPSDLAAWTVVVQTVLNSDATIWKR